MLDRTFALEYLVNESGINPLAIRANIVSTDTGDNGTVSGYKTVIDNAFQSFGVDYFDLPTAQIDESNISALKTALKYFALQLMVLRLASQKDVKLPGGVEDLKTQVFKQAKQLFDDVKKDFNAINGSGEITQSYFYYNYR